MIFSYLIVPAVCANLLVRRLGARMLVGWLVATGASITGLCFSYDRDLPMGASIVCALGLALLIVGIVARMLSRFRPGIGSLKSEDDAALGSLTGSRHAEARPSVPPPPEPEQRAGS